MSKPPFHKHIIEEFDIGIGAGGWDNFLLYDDTSGLEEYLTALRYLNASKCAAVVKELLDLVAATKPAHTIDLTDSHTAQLDLLWRQYNEASCAENPQELAKRAFEQD